MNGVKESIAGNEFCLGTEVTYPWVETQSLLWKL